MVLIMGSTRENWDPPGGHKYTMFNLSNVVYKYCYISRLDSLNMIRAVASPAICLEPVCELTYNRLSKLRSFAPTQVFLTTHTNTLYVAIRACDN